MPVIEEMKAHDASSVLVAEEDGDVGEVVDHFVRVLSGQGLLCTVTAVVPPQLLAYHVATERGFDLDKPRNLTGTTIVE